MVRLETEHSLRPLQKLPFCYVCGRDFMPAIEIDHDHVPAKAVFDKKHRQSLKLPTHVMCNHGHHLADEKIGQMIALRRYQAAAPNRRKLHALQTNLGPAIINLNVDAVVWRWIAGFHAALYRSPLVFKPTGKADQPYVRSLVLPFPKRPRSTKRIDPIAPQHQAFVKTLKDNRLLNNVDRLHCNKGQLVYESVWGHFDGQRAWVCLFALNVCDWKDLGTIPSNVARGCAGMYMLDDGSVPSEASRVKQSKLLLPNYDTFDPFAR